jgi:hypothetical protein
MNAHVSARGPGFEGLRGVLSIWANLGDWYEFQVFLAMGTLSMDLRENYRKPPYFMGKSVVSRCFQ